MRSNLEEDLPWRRLLVPAWFLWLAITLLTLILFWTGVPAHYEQLVLGADERVLNSLHISAQALAVYVLALSHIIVLTHLAIAAIIFVRRKDDWMALLVSMALITNGPFIPLSLMYRSIKMHALWHQSVLFIIYLGLLSSMILLYIFPDGRFVPRWTRYLAFLWAFFTLPSVFLPQAIISFSNWPTFFQFMALMFWSGTGIFAQVYRYANVSSPLQRQQAKWALLGLVAAVLNPYVYFLPYVIIPAITSQTVPNLLFQRMGATFFTFSFVFRLSGLSFFTLITLLFPVSFAIAILRHRLWDIDLLINRAMVYAALSASLLFVYLGTVLLLQEILRLLTGERQPEMVTIVSTLAIAGLFTPLRRQMQAWIDRRFYRRKYDAIQTMAAFSALLRKEVNLDQLASGLVTVVEETVQPKHVSLWLNKPKTGEK